MSQTFSNNREPATIADLPAQPVPAWALPPDLAARRVLPDPQAMAYAGVPRRSWERLKRSPGFPPAIRLAGSRLGRRLCDLDAWLDRRAEVEPSPAARRNAR